MNRSRLASLGLVSLVILAFLAWAFWPRAIPVDMAVASRGTILVTIDEEAEACVHDVFEVSAPFSGRLLRVAVEPGDPVVAGETVVARMMPANPDALDIRTTEQAAAAVDAAQAALALAEADQSRAEADLDLAETSLERAESLLKVSATSEAEFDSAKRNKAFAAAQLRSATALIQVRAAELRQARALLMSFETGSPATLPEDVSGMPVVAAASGVVLQLHQQSEATVAAGAPILDLGDPAHDLEVVAELLSPEAVRIRSGDEVIIERWGGDRPLSGKIRTVEPWAFTKVSALGIEEQRVKVMIDLTDPPEARVGLGHGYRVYVKIVTDRRDDAVIVPSNSIFTSDGGDHVFLHRGGRALLTPVSLGITNGALTQLVGEGLEDAEVVLYPSADLEHGDRIKKRS